MGSGSWLARHPRVAAELGLQRNTRLPWRIPLRVHQCAPFFPAHGGFLLLDYVHFDRLPGLLNILSTFRGLKKSAMGTAVSGGASGSDNGDAGDRKWIWREAQAWLKCWWRLCGWCSLLEGYRSWGWKDTTGRRWSSSRRWWRNRWSTTVYYRWIIVSASHLLF